MWLRREPNNRSKPTHLKSFSATQRQPSSESEDFPVLIQPNFLMDFLSDIFCPNLSKKDDPNLLETSSKRSQSRDQASSRRAKNGDIEDFAAGTNHIMTDHHFVDLRSRNIYRRHCKPDLEGCQIDIDLSRDRSQRNLTEWRSVFGRIAGTVRRRGNGM